MFARSLALILTLSPLALSCAEPPACQALVERLCGAAGEAACEMLKSKTLTDEASCKAVLDDTKALNQQLDALVAASAAKALNPSGETTPTTPK